MSLTTRKNAATKALQSVLANGKKHDANIQLEWEIACNTNVNRGKVYSQSEIHLLYSRIVGNNEECGATKVCHLINHNGVDFKYIVIKRMKRNAYNGLGNQLITEIECWNKYAETNDADYLCPILKYFTSKSDKVTKDSDTMANNVVIIAQRAVYVADAETACRKAERLNAANGYKGEDAATRYEKLKAFSSKNKWWDAIHNGGNSGVIFDYSKNCYKAVFIDYAL